MTSIFLSYATVDRKIVDKIRRDLESRNYSTWMDHCQIRGGQEWETEIATNLARCEIFLVNITEASNNSKWVRRETILAEQLKKKRIPLLLNSEIPFRLIDVQFIDFRKSYQDGISNLLEVLATLAPSSGADDDSACAGGGEEPKYSFGATITNFLVGRWIKQKTTAKVHKVKMPTKVKPSREARMKRASPQTRPQNTSMGLPGMKVRPTSTQSPDFLLNGSVGDSASQLMIPPQPQNEGTAATATSSVAPNGEEADHSRKMIKRLLFCVPHGWIEEVAPTKEQLEKDKDFLCRARFELSSVESQTGTTKYADGVNKFLDNLLDHIESTGRKCRHRIIVGATGIIAFRLRVNNKELGIEFTPDSPNHKLLLEGIDNLLGSLLANTSGSVFLGGTWPGSVCILLKAPDSVIDVIVNRWREAGMDEFGLGDDFSLVGVYSVFSAGVPETEVPIARESQSTEGERSTLQEDACHRLCNSLDEVVDEFLIAAADSNYHVSSGRVEFMSCKLDDEDDVFFLIPGNRHSVEAFFSNDTGCWFPAGEAPPRRNEIPTDKPKSAYEVTESTLSISSHVDFAFNADNLNTSLREKIRKWLLSFRRLDPRYQILTAFNQAGEKENPHSVYNLQSDSDSVSPDESLEGKLSVSLQSRLSRVFNKPSYIMVMRPSSTETMRIMMEGRGVGKGLDIRGQPAKEGSLSSFVPFMQIHDNQDKERIQELRENARMRVYFYSEKARRTVIDIILVPGTLELLDEYENNGLYGIEVSQRLFWEGIILPQDITRDDDTKTGQVSLASFQDANMRSLATACRKNPLPSPMPVVIQYDRQNPIRPQTLLMAYEENGTVTPVVSSFQGVLLGWRREPLWFGCNLPREQEYWMTWSVDRIEDILKKTPSDDSWTVRWLEVLKIEASKSLLPEMPQYGFGDPNSYRMVESAAKILSDTGALRHGFESFNYLFPQELGNRFLVLHDTLHPLPWKCLNLEELQEFLIENINKGFMFPLNPKWILCDPGWEKVYDALMKSEALYADLSKDVWFPPHSGVRERIEEIRQRYPKGFQRRSEGSKMITATGQVRDNPLQQYREREVDRRDTTASDLASFMRDELPHSSVAPDDSSSSAASDDTCEYVASDDSTGALHRGRQLSSVASKWGTFSKKKAPRKIERVKKESTKSRDMTSRDLSPVSRILKDSKDMRDRRKQGATRK